jgi:hypothetical protein
MTCDFVESQLTGRLERFKKTGNRYEFRCPYCGDGRGTKSKRGNIYLSKNEWMFNCYNCATGRSLKNFVKDNFPELSRYFILQKKMEEQMSEPENSHILDSVEWYRPASESIVAVEYLRSRGITSTNDIFYTSSAPSEIIGKKNGLAGEPCLVFSLKSLKDQCFSGYQLRAVSQSKLRYSTLCYEKSYYGEMVDAPILVEGIFDALSCKNSVAILGSGNSFSVKDSIWFLDQEPHNKEIVKKMKKLIEAGEKVCMLSKEFLGLDSNDMLKSGMSSEQVEALVRSKSYSGGMAKIKLLEWVGS